MPIDFGLSSPLIDLFARGPLPADMRLLAASNQVAVDPVEQIALLAILTGDGDPGVAARAWETWRAFPAGVVADVLAASATPDRLRAWMAEHGGGHAADLPAVGPVSAGDPPPEAPAQAALDAPTASAAEPMTPAATDGSPETGVDEGQEPDQEVKQLASLPVPVRIKMAMLGTREQRAVLVRDPNRVVSSAVLSSPKLSETEVENFARMTNVAADVLRIIGTNRSWLRSYTVVSALVRNPRTPPAISLGLVPRLQERELKGLAVDRNVPEVLRVMSRKALAAKASRRE